MTHVILQHCCVDGACVDVCPVNCIHPLTGELEAEQAEMLYIDPATCIDCGACADICPVGAIASDYDLEEADERFIELNAAYFEQPGARDYTPRRRPGAFPASRASSETLRVAIVGTGPAACYAATELLERRGDGVRVEMFDRLLTPGGLARFGVAPDHLATRTIVDRFERLFDDPRVTLRLGIEIGRDIAAADLATAYDAVIYAVGAGAERAMELAGGSLPGSLSATEFVGWYNGHPDFADHRFDFSAKRAIVIGNGNVALDVARILAQEVERLHRSDIAAHALTALRDSSISEIVVLGRRSPLEAAFTLPELLGLHGRDDFSLWTDFPTELGAMLLDAQATRSAPWSARRKLAAIHDLPRQPASGGKSIRLSFLRTPEAVIGEERASALRQRVNRLELDENGTRITASDHSIVEDAGLIVRAAGFRGVAIAGTAFDDQRGIMPNVGGRLMDPDTGAVRQGHYVTGWIKRGPSGSMGTNKSCARETVAALLDDLEAGLLADTVRDRPLLHLPEHATITQWRAIDAHERAQGRRTGRPRVKLVDRAELRRIAAQGEA
ncbi:MULTISPECIES: 4Fe-4S binding protein [unclassified Sphingomonas]|uniref:4Fe-4S binding protein n=1 Tax=unclassified Sphingomonas TaxID=196159 RepID=UPI0008327A00|nr:MULTISPECIES: 4Fe-4S binding protein [unclassified Sphingomonas]